MVQTVRMGPSPCVTLPEAVKEDMTATSSLTCDRAEFAYRSGFRVGPISLELGAGVTCLVGANGAGKSTLFRLLTGEQRPSVGRVALGEGARVGFLPQAPALPGHATVEEFLVHVAWLQGISKRARGESVARALAMVDLADKRATRISSLSGGMQRRLGIAQAVVHDPQVVVLDEPTVGLDPLQRVAVREVLAELGHERVVIVSTHLVEDVRALAARVLVMTSGRIAFDGTVSGLEDQADEDAPGDSDLERGLAALMGSVEAAG